MSQTRCIDCNAMGRQTDRPAYHPSREGPRCEEHWRIEKKRRSVAAHAKRIEDTYEISGEEYWAIYEAQGGRCHMCRRAKGKSKRLCVDHDHNCPENSKNKPGGHDPKNGCRKCVRALLCVFCNDVVGKLDADALARGIEVLENAPAQKVLVHFAAKGS